MIDELVVSTDVDCDKETGKHCSRNQTFKPAEIHIHEGWKKNGKTEYVGSIHFVTMMN